MVNVTTIDDDIVEGTEVISVFITPGPTATISLFIADNDCKPHPSLILTVIQCTH